MSIALHIHSHHPAKTANLANWDIGLWLLLGLPVVALLAFLAVALVSPNGQVRPDFGYDQWLPASAVVGESGGSGG